MKKPKLHQKTSFLGIVLNKTAEHMPTHAYLIDKIGMNFGVPLLSQSPIELGFKQEMAGILKISQEAYQDEPFKVAIESVLHVTTNIGCLHGNEGMRIVRRRCVRE